MSMTIHRQAAAALAALESVLSPLDGAMACGPLEHGLRYYEARARGEDGADARSGNEARLSAFVSTLRARLRRPVIDPGPLRVAGWGPRDYDAFFLEVIRRFVGQAWFVDGWEYSDGATKELILCMSLGRDVLDERGVTITSPTATSRLAAAVEHLAGLGVDHARLRARLEVLADT